MDVTIKPMKTPSEFEGKAYVHWRSCHETYQGLVGQSYLDDLTLEKCTKAAYQWPDNILVAKEGETVAGFAGYGIVQAGDPPETGEVFALYVLGEYRGKRVGYALMQAALRALSDYPKVCLWVLKGNERAIRFYEKCGFQFDGTERTIILGKKCTKLRMMLVR